MQKTIIMIIGKQAFEYSRRTLYIVIGFLSTGMLFGQEKSAIEILYLEYSRDGSDKNRVSLNFEIRNTTQDTIFLSRDHIIMTVRKGRKHLAHEHFSGPGQPFVRPRIRPIIPCEEKQRHEAKMDSLKSRFAELLYEKNFGITSQSNVDRNWVVEHIGDKCLILLPMEVIEYSKIFRNSEFDKSCLVNARYEQAAVFTSFHSHEKVIEILR